jgi:DNA-binding response OmpR family regulator
MSRPLRVLVIDDDDALRALLTHYVRRQWPQAEVEHYDPLERNLPDAAFPLGSFDVVILDYLLGRGDGLEWLRKLKARSDCPKVLFLTGAGSDVVAVRAMRAGADDYQRKQLLTAERFQAAMQELAASLPMNRE